MPVDVDQSGEPDSAERQNAEPPIGTFMGFWVNVSVSIFLAGATLGLISGFAVGSTSGSFIIYTICGAVIFGMLSTPFICTVAILSWALWLTRFSLGMAIIAGACSGALFPVLLGGRVQSSSAVVAAVAGGLFSGIAAQNYSKKYGWPNRSSNANGKNIWQFSLRDLFLRFTAVSILIAVWTALLARLLR